ncbi:hypothetical protein Plhal703r1_c05g0029031 [Plasmopara halstedii]
MFKIKMSQILNFLFEFCHRTNSPSESDKRGGSLASGCAKTLMRLQKISFCPTGSLKLYRGMSLTQNTVYARILVEY